MDKKITIIVVLLSAILIVSFIQAFQLMNIKAKISAIGLVTGGGGSAAASGKLDTTGWTENEKMNYEMHGTIPARIGQSSGSGSSASTMVGGC